MTDEGGLVALATQGDGSHVGGVGLQDDAVQRDDSRQRLGQVTFLEGEHTTDAEHEALELQQLTGFLLITREAMEYTTGQVGSVLLQNGQQLILRLTAVNHQRKLRLHRPTDLLFESLQLLLLELTAPVEVESYLADGDERGVVRSDW